MSTFEAQSRREFVARRARLYTPPHAVFDHGIDLRRVGRGFHVRLMPWAPEYLAQRIVLAPEPKPAKPPAPLPKPKRTRLWKLLGAGQIARIVTMVAAHYDVTDQLLYSPLRTARLVRPRQVAMYLSRAITRRSFPELARRIGGRDHTTVLYGVRKIERMTLADFEFGARMACLECVIREKLP